MILLNKEQAICTRTDDDAKNYEESDAVNGPDLVPGHGRGHDHVPRISLI